MGPDRLNVDRDSVNLQDRRVAFTFEIIIEAVAGWVAVMDLVFPLLPVSLTDEGVRIECRLIANISSLRASLREC